MSMNKFFIKIFGSRNERLLKRYWKIVTQINALEEKTGRMTDDLYSGAGGARRTSRYPISEPLAS